jgi:hypothetical protein
MTSHSVSLQETLTGRRTVLCLCRLTLMTIVLYCIYFGPRNPEDIGQVNVQQYKPQNN